MTNDVSNEPATKADLKELEQRLEHHPTKSDLRRDLEGWAERIIAVVRTEFDHRMPQLKRELRAELVADLRSEAEITRAEMRAHVEELKATHVPRAEFEAHRDDSTLHRQPRRRRSKVADG